MGLEGRKDVIISEDTSISASKLSKFEHMSEDELNISVSTSAAFAVRSWNTPRPRCRKARVASVSVHHFGCLSEGEKVVGFTIWMYWPSPSLMFSMLMLLGSRCARRAFDTLSCGRNAWTRERTVERIGWCLLSRW